MSITIFTGMDDLFDARRGMIHKLAVESGNKRFDWDRNFAPVYKRRRMDYFQQPEHGVTNEAYQKRYAQRSIEDFEDQDNVYVRPSNLMKNMFNIVRELEFGVGQMISASSFDLTVNLFPYVIEGELLDQLASVIRGAVPFNISLSFVNLSYEEQLPKVLHSYDFVFKYDYFISKEMKPYWDAYAIAPPTGTKIIVPDVIAAEKELPEEMKGEELIDLIGKMNATQGGKITWVPVTKTIFDYKE